MLSIFTGLIRNWWSTGKNNLFRDCLIWFGLLNNLLENYNWILKPLCSKCMTALIWNPLNYKLPFCLWSLTHLRHLLAQLLIITTTYNFFIASGGTTDFLLLITVLHLPSGSGLMLKAVNICCCLTSGWVVVLRCMVLLVSVGKVIVRRCWVDMMLRMLSQLRLIPCCLSWYRRVCTRW